MKNKRRASGIAQTLQECNLGKKLLDFAAAVTGQFAFQ